MRTSLKIDVEGYRLFGTMHDKVSSNELEVQKSASRTGVLILSFGQQNRSWVGDLASSIADRLEEKEYPVFRFDLPGLGDSPGELPVFLEDLGRDVQLGSHDRPLLALCNELVRKFSLQGLIICGNCGGAVAPLYLVNSRLPYLRGLVLVEPELALVPANSSAQNEPAKSMTVVAYYEGIQLLLRRIASLASWRKLMFGKADYRFWLRLWSDLINYRIRHLKYSAAMMHELPKEANHRMMQSWRLARRLQIPTLVMTVGAPIRSRYYRAYGLSPGVDDISSHLKWIEIQNTTHGMLTGGAKETVARRMEDWIVRCCPVGKI